MLEYGPQIINDSVSTVNAKVSSTLNGGNKSWQLASCVGLIHIQGRYTEVNIDQNTEENVTEFGATWNTIGLTLQA